jgi:hypothetical protein
MTVSGVRQKSSMLKAERVEAQGSKLKAERQKTGLSDIERIP